MTKFEVDYSYKLPAYGMSTFDALDTEEAEQLAMESIRESEPEAVDIEIDAVRAV